MISRKTHTPKKLKLKHTKMEAHTLKKPTRQKSNFIIYTQRGNPNEQIQSDEKTLNLNNTPLTHWKFGKSSLLSSIANK